MILYSPVDQFLFKFLSSAFRLSSIYRLSKSEMVEVKTKAKTNGEETKKEDTSADGDSDLMDALSAEQEFLVENCPMALKLVQTGQLVPSSVTFNSNFKQLDGFPFSCF